MTLIEQISSNIIHEIKQLSFLNKKTYELVKSKLTTSEWNTNILDGKHITDSTAKYLKNRVDEILSEIGMSVVLGKNYNTKLTELFETISIYYGYITKYK